MAWEATCLLSPILLVLLASGSWAQDTVLHQTVEGKTISVRCQYDPRQRLKEKVWCQETPGKTCEILVSSLNTDAQRPKLSLRDHPESQFFTVTMTALSVRDSGLYFCGIAENHRTILVLRNIHLKVSKVGSNTPASAMIPTQTRTEVPTISTPKDPSTVSARVSIYSIVVPVVCGLFIKTLVFTVLFAVTQRSFG